VVIVLQRIHCWCIVWFVNWFFYWSCNILMSLKNQYTTYVLEPENIEHELDTRAEKKAQARYEYIIAEKKEKVILAQIKQKIKAGEAGKISQAEATDRAYLHEDYNKWLVDFAAKQKEKDLATDKYNNKVAYTNMKVTEESSARHLINKK